MAHLVLVEGGCGAFTTIVYGKLKGGGPTDDESLTHMYRSFSKAELAAARRHIGLKAVGMTGEYKKI